MTLERFKTGVLIVLVFFSIVMSAAIWTYAPPSAAGDNPRSYGPPDPSYGPVKTVEQVINPSQIVIHLGSGKHTVLRPFEIDSTKLLESLKGISVYAPTSGPFTESDWAKVVNQKGVELDFGLTLTSPLLHQLLSFVVASGPNVHARMIYITEADHNDWMVWLFNGIEQPAFSARISLNSVNLSSFIAIYAKKYPGYTVYQSMSQSYYLPVNPVSVPIEVRKVVSWDGNRLARQYFADPFLMKRISDIAGVSVYTDGSHGVTVDQKSNTLTYENSSSTATNFNSATPINLQLQKVLDFVHSGGDLPGDWLVYQNDNIGTPANESNFAFKQYINGMPIHNMISYTPVTMVSSAVVSQTRSLQNIGTIVNENYETVMSASQLFAALKRDGVHSNQVTEVYLGYGIILLSENQLKLAPVYVMQLDGLEKVFDASTGMPFVG